ncbi:GNAT family N-acetyltransferase [Massilia agri]|uniref:GNAT family N-acetyltransferase n=1 Tax=Massilia agri TaxID=1886785 RepID=A0ABT2ARF9_9BURK|nr:GNAT family N-acetyltransferase [Massilia agri]MCS0598844.1 GNAT family N-acetyltransferase [Massilia agri]
MDVIRTPRLVLRGWRREDAPVFYAINQDARVHEFLPGPMSMEQVEAFIAFQLALFARTRACYFALETEGALAGFVGLKRHDADSLLPFAPCTDIGWRLAPAYWGKGIAGEAARACLAYGFGELQLEEIVSFTVPENLRSRAVMEKLGMREDTGGGFAHPALPPEHRLSRHVLYRLRR